MKQPLTQDELINWWLKEYHNTSLAEVVEKHKEWDIYNKETWNPLTFYKEYRVTQQQHDEWYKWAIERVRKHYNWGRKYAQKQFAFEYLNCAPMVWKDDSISSEK